MLKFLESLAVWFLCVYLRLCLWVGCSTYVLRLFKEWDRNTRKPIRSAAAWGMQGRLIDLGLLHQCPSCGWGTELLDGHMQDRNGWCYKQTLPQCPNCYQPLEEGTQCANCKINQQIDEQQRELQQWAPDRELVPEEYYGYNPDDKLEGEDEPDISDDVFGGERIIRERFANGDEED